MTEELEQKAEEYLREHSKYSEVFNQTFICVDTLTAMVEFATETTKELQEENKQAKEIIRELYKYIKVFYPKADFTIKAEAFLKE